MTGWEEELHKVTVERDQLSKENQELKKRVKSLERILEDIEESVEDDLRFCSGGDHPHIKGMYETALFYKELIEEWRNGQ